MTKWENQAMENIEMNAKIRFKKVGLPQIKDIVTANARDISHGFNKVSEDVLPYFSETAKSIFQKYEPEEAMCRALAMISGYTQLM